MNRITVYDKIEAPYGFSIVSPLYHLILAKRIIRFTVDKVPYSLDRPGCIFLSPYQQFLTQNISDISILGFHGDFYCIEYHKKQVACNGILFNNIYTPPYIVLELPQYHEIETIFQKINVLQNRFESYEEALIKAYLQVILALSSKEKQKALPIETQDIISPYLNFKEIIEEFYIQERTLGFYADYYGTNAQKLSKKIKALFGKPPSVLIRERLILEAKKFLHLTYKNINEIAYELGFEDEFYFSRYFKKEVGISPKKYRKDVGISIVAK